MLGVVTGLRAEARLAAPLGRVLAGGGLPEGAARAAARLVGEGVSALLSFGLAGGLSPHLRAGTVIVPLDIVTPDGRFTTDAALNAWLGGAAGTLFGAAAAVATVAGKRALHDQTGADAVDLESGVVAATAHRHGIPFAALRAVCDPADGDLPPAALLGLDANGAIAFARILRSLAHQPSQIGALIRLSQHAAAARQALIGRVTALSRYPI